MASMLTSILLLLALLGAVVWCEQRPVDLAQARETMVREHLQGGGIRSQSVLQAMSRVPRHEFVPAELRDRAYEDRPLPIGHMQTISQPFIVAYMTEAADIQRGERVLEIGTGSGYQAAVLGELGAEVYSIEIVPELATRAAGTLKKWVTARSTRGPGTVTQAGPTKPRSTRLW